MTVPVLGLDIGGANLKAALVGTDVRCHTMPFALWRNPAGLGEALTRLLDTLPSPEVLAVTMTGELCDCFASKRDGVLHILDAVERVAAGRRIHIWCTDGLFRDLDAARACDPLLVAAANWLALAAWAGRLAPQGSALLLDIGSTTTDIIPLADGVPVPAARTDPGRLASGELLYRGVRRTPICAILGSEVAAEWFATTLDVYLVLGEIASDPSDNDTADGRPATPEHAHARLARMFCADLFSSTPEDRLGLARKVRQLQIADVCDRLKRICKRLPSLPDTVLLAGSGEFLARAVVQASTLKPSRLVSFAATLGQAISTAACAYAVAALAP